MRRAHAVALVATLALVGAACGGQLDTDFPPETEEPTGTETTTEPTGPSDRVTVVAKQIAFNTPRLLLKANVQVTITLDNQDVAVEHNVAIYGDDTLKEKIFVPKTFAGPDSRDYVVPPTPPGTYFFRCDIHPNMNGQAVFQ